MSSASRDIKRTLVIKLLLLFMLWLVCFRGTEKFVVDGKHWLLGTHASHAIQNTQQTEVISNDSRH